MLLSRRKLPLNALRAFEVAARHCQLRAAAEELGVSHSAVSRQIKQLESLLQLELFDRSHNRMNLTSAGQQLLEGVSKSLDNIAETVLHLNPDSVEGGLVIASTPTIGSGWLVSVITDFCRRYPDVNIRLLNIEPRQQVLPSEVEIAICYGEPDPGGRDCKALFRENYFAVCHRSFLSEAEGFSKPQELLQLPLLHDRHDLWQSWFTSIGITETIPQQIFFEDSFQVLTAIRSGFGVGLVEKIEVQDELKRGELVQLFNHAVQGSESLFMVMDNEQRATLRAKLFVQHLQESLKIQP